jgi:NADH-quinone oxidoreductase subunit M
MRLPGLAGFVGEFLILLGVFQVSPVFAVIGVGGMIVSVIYALGIIQRVFHGPPVKPALDRADMTAREWVMMGAMAALILWLGLAPQRLLDTSQPAIQAMRQAAEARATHTPDADQAVGAVSEGLPVPEVPP